MAIASLMARAHQRPCPEILLIGFQVVGTVAHQSVALLEPERHAQRNRNCLSDVFLDSKNPFELSILALGPQMCAVVCFDKLGGDADLVAVLPHRAFNKMTRSQRSPAIRAGEVLQIRASREGPELASSRHFTMAR